MYLRCDRSFISIERLRSTKQNNQLIETFTCIAISPVYMWACVCACFHTHTVLNGPLVILIRSFGCLRFIWRIPIWMRARERERESFVYLLTIRAEIIQYLVAHKTYDELPWKVTNDGVGNAILLATHFSHCLCVCVLPFDWRQNERTNDQSLYFSPDTRRANDRFCQPKNGLQTLHKIRLM